LSLFNGCTDKKGSIDKTNSQDQVKVAHLLSQIDSNLNNYINQVDIDCLSLKSRAVMTCTSEIDRSEDPLQFFNSSNFQISMDGNSKTPEDIHLAPIDNFILDPISIVIIMDYSTSITDFPKVQAAMEEAVIGFIDLMHPKDQAEIIKFNTGIRYLQPFTNDKSLLTAAVVHLENVTGGYTYLYDTLYTAIEDVVVQKTERKAVIAITDGTERHIEGVFGGGRGKKDIIVLAQAQKIPIFIIGLGPSIDAEDLVEITKETSGHFYQATTVDKLTDIYINISNILNFGQYLFVLETPSNGRYRNQLTRLATINGMSNDVNTTISYTICP
jgi:VWFA-related protein